MSRCQVCGEPAVELELSADAPGAYCERHTRPNRARAIPATRVDAIEALVDSDVRRWGEAERAASRRVHSHRSFGSALNELANRAELDGAPDPDLRAAADAALTPADWRKLKGAT